MSSFPSAPRRLDLGFGLVRHKQLASGGYFSCTATLVLHEGALISLRISLHGNPPNQEETRLLERKLLRHPHVLGGVRYRDWREVVQIAQRDLLAAGSSVMRGQEVSASRDLSPIADPPPEKTIIETYGCDVQTTPVRTLAAEVDRVLQVERWIGTAEQRKNCQR